MTAPQQRQGAAGRGLSRVAVVGIVAAVVIVLVAGLVFARQLLGPDQSTVSAPVNLGAHVEISPAAAFLSDIGQTRQLTAHAFDAAGSPSTGAATWSSSHPATVEVAADGMITAKALGSSTISAVVGGVISAPVLVVVAGPAAGVILVSDEQIVGQLEPTDPTAEPAFGNTYRVALTGLTPKVGDLLGGTGEKPLAGRVVAVDGATVTLQQVPLAELVPDLAIDEVIDLANARIVVPEEVARLYNVSRNGDTYDFTPKANFNDLLPTSSRSGAQLAMAGPLPDRTQLVNAAGGAQGTSALPPFSKCEALTTPSSQTSPLSLAGTSPPSFSFDVHPTATILITAQNGFEKVLIGSTFKVTAKATLKVAAAFSGSFGCEIELWKFLFPAPGLLGLALGAIIPIKAGFTVSGKVTIASIELGAEASAATALELGVACPAGSGCELVNNMADVTTTWKPIVNGPTWSDLRLQPALEVFGAAEVLIGPPFVDQLQLNLLRAKAGAKLGADWAPKPVQIADGAYASNYALTLEAGIKVGPKLTDIAALLGTADILSKEYKVSTELAHSPTGKVSFDKPTYTTGDSGVATVVMDPANLTFLGGYNIERLLLVQHLPGEERVLDTSAGASQGQREFELRFTATGPIAASDLYAFVVTKVPALDLFALELAGGSSGGVTADSSASVYGVVGCQQWIPANQCTEWTKTRPESTPLWLETKNAGESGAMDMSANSQFKVDEDRLANGALRAVTISGTLSVRVANGGQARTGAEYDLDLEGLGPLLQWTGTVSGQVTGSPVSDTTAANTSANSQLVISIDCGGDELEYRFDKSAGGSFPASASGADSPGELVDVEDGSCDVSFDVGVSAAPNHMEAPGQTGTAKITFSITIEISGTG
ncbi:MAG: Ig-like domain-containing protein [Candidatus Limnocylindrales bacterium]